MSGFYRTGRGPHFAPVPMDLLRSEDKRVDALTIATYAALKSFADFGMETGAAVSDATAAQRAHCSPRAFRERRSRLRDLGWVEWHTVNTAHGRVNEYVVHSSPPPPAG